MSRTAIILAGLILAFGAGPAVATDVDIGPITVVNNFDVEVTVTVYHADDIDEAFSSYKVKPGKSLELDYEGKPLVLGGDWLIKVRPAGMDPSKRRLLYKVAEFKSGAFTVQAKKAYEGK
jgi:hypothetical protein